MRATTAGWGRAALVALVAVAGVRAPGVRAQVYGADETQYEIWQLRCENRYDEALELARALAERHRQNPDIAPHVLRADGPQVTALETAARLSPWQRQELAEIDAVGPAITAASARGDYREARRLSLKQLEVYRRLLGPVNLDVGRTLTNIAHFDVMLGEEEQARQRLVESLEVRRALLGDDHPEVALSLSRMAALHMGRGEVDDAEPLLRRVVSIRENTLGATHPHTASALHELGEALEARGDYAGAEVLHRRALAIERRLEPDAPRLATGLEKIAALALEQGKLLEAEEVQQEALQIRRRVLGDEHPHVAASLLQQARVREARGNLAGAEEALREALRIRTQVFGADNPRVAAVMLRLAAVGRERRKFATAESLLADAEARVRDKLGERHPRLADVWAERARLRAAQGDLAAAEVEYERALERHAAVRVASHPELVRERRELGAVLLRAGKVDAAVAVLSRAARDFEVARRRLRETARGTFEDSPYPLLAAAYLARGDGEPAWDAVERSLGRALMDVRARARARSPEERRRLRALQQRVADLESRVAALLEASASDAAGADTTLVRLQRQLAEAEAAWVGHDTALREAERAARATAGAGASVDGDGAVSRAALQARLDPHTAAIGWLDVDLGDRVERWAYVVRQHGPVVWERLEPVVRVAGGNAAGGDVARGNLTALDGTPPQDACRRLRSALQLASTWPFRVRDDARLRRLARAAWEDRLAALAPHLEGARRLLVFPSGELLDVPLGAMVDADGAYLVERFAVTVVPSPRFLLRATPHEKPAARNARVLLVGDPAFTPGAEDDRMAEAPSNPRADMDGAANPPETLASASARPGSPGDDTIVLRRALEGDARALGALAPLPGTRMELDAVAQVLPRVTVLLGSEASEQRLTALQRSGALRDYAVLHLATHALVDLEHPERSALVLARDALPDPVVAVHQGTRSFDGLLNAREIVQEWELDADLVTLSACHTALGAGRSREGYRGLASAFLQAGARSLVVTLWPVDDAATAQWMARFYRNLAGDATTTPMPKDRAAREASRWLRAYVDPRDGSRPFAHPTYWAAFTVVGAPD